MRGEETPQLHDMTLCKFLPQTFEAISRVRVFGLAS